MISAIFVWLKSEHWHWINHCVDHSWSANKVGSKGNCNPKILVYQLISDPDKDWDQRTNAGEHYDVLSENGLERKADRDIIIESFVDEIKKLLCLRYLRSFHKPFVFWFIEVWVLISLLHLLWSSQIWHSIKVVRGEKFSHCWVTGIVNDSHKGWRLQFIFFLSIGIWNTSVFIEELVTLFTSSFNSEKSNHIKGSRIL